MAARSCEFKSRPGHHITPSWRNWQTRWFQIPDVPSSNLGEGTTHAKLTGIGIPGCLKSSRFPVRLRGFAPRTVAKLADAHALKATSPQGMPVRLRPVRPISARSSVDRAGVFYTHGREFDSLRAGQYILPVAQLEERQNPSLEDAGSNPARQAIRLHKTIGSSVGQSGGLITRRPAVRFRPYRPDRVRSSVGQSSGLIIHWSWVRAPADPPPTRNIQAPFSH